MRGYGLPRNKEVECPDVADIINYGLRTALGSLDGRAYQNSKSKKRARRIWKKKARRDNKQVVLDQC